MLTRRRRMRRHPAPTLLFVDLVGYTALTDEQGDEAAARVAPSSGARCASSAATTAPPRSSQWATA
jgi:class 3 adenylate cyclase